MTYTTYIRNDITMETVDVIHTSTITEVFRKVINLEVFESAFTVCFNNTVIDWKFIHNIKLKGLI